MAYVNNYQCCGNLVRDPEPKHHANGDYVKFVVALNRPGRDKPFYIDCIAWNDTGQKIVDLCRQGTEVYLCGEIETSNYIDQRGSHHKGFSLKVEKFSITKQPQREVRRPAAIRKPDLPALPEKRDRFA